MVKEIDSLQYGAVKIVMEMKEEFTPVVVSVYLDVWYITKSKVQKHSVNSKCNVPSQEAPILFLTTFRTFRQSFQENSEIIIICHELGFNRNVSASFNSLVKGLPRHLHPYGL
jgi:hypothetical protein